MKGICRDDHDEGYLKQIFLIRNDVGLHGSCQAVHPLQVRAEWSWCGHDDGLKTVSSFVRRPDTDSGEV